MAACSRDIDPLRGRGVFRPRLRARAAHDLPRRAQAAAGAHAGRAARRSRCRAAAILGRALRRRRQPRSAPSDACDELRRAAARVGAAAHDLRSAARRVPVRRRRFERGRRDDGRRWRTARSTPARSASTTRTSTRPRFAQQVADRYRTAPSQRSRRSDDFDLIDTLARLYDEPYRRQLGDPDLPRLPARAQARHGGAVGRRRRRDASAAIAATASTCSRSSMRSTLPLGVRRPVFGALGRAYPKADWAPRVFRAKTTFEALGARLGRGVLPHDVADPATPHARSAVQPGASSASSRATTRSR